MHLRVLDLLSCHSDRTGAVASSPREMEHTSAPMIEQTAKTTGEEAQAGDALALKASTSSVPEKAADATPVDAGLLEHVSVLRLVLQNLYRVREQRSRWE